MLYGPVTLKIGFQRFQSFPVIAYKTVGYKTETLSIKRQVEFAAEFFRVDNLDTRYYSIRRG